MLDVLYDSYGYGEDIVGMDTFAKQGIIGYDTELERDVDIMDTERYRSEGGVTNTDLRQAKCDCQG